MAAHNAFNGRSYIIDFRYGGGSACWFLDSDDTMKLNLESVSFSWVPALDVWEHWCVVSPASSAVKVYRDGAVAYTSSGTGSSATAKGNAVVGTLHEYFGKSGDYFMNAIIDSLFFTHVVLDDTQVSQLYANNSFAVTEVQRGGALSEPLYGTLSSGLAVNTVSEASRTLRTNLSFSTTPVLNGAVLFEVDVLPAGSFTDAGAFSVSIGIEFERLSSDCDLMIGIRIGTDVFLVSAQDNNNGLYTLLRGTHTPGETHATRPRSNHQEIASSTGKTEPETIAITFSWAAGATDGSVSITLANGFSTTLAMTGEPLRHSVPQ